jgi:ribosomal protein S12 methylthiotransferase
VGFPGETEQEFQELLDFLEEAQLERVGCFKYSPVDGAQANELDGAVPEEIKQERWERFMEVQNRISTEKLAKKIGQTMTVIVDAVDEEGAICRSKADAPEIDGNVFIEGVTDLPIGEFVDVEIVDASDYDLWGELVSN